MSYSTKLKNNKYIKLKIYKCNECSIASLNSKSKPTINHFKHTVDHLIRQQNSNTAYQVQSFTTGKISRVPYLLTHLPDSG